MTGDVTVIESAGRVVEMRSGTNAIDVTPNMKGVWLPTQETPPVTEQVGRLISAVESAIPPFTNRLHEVLVGTSEALTNLSTVTHSIMPTISNLTLLSARLNESDGALGRWLFPTNFDEQLDATLVAARSSFATAQETMTGVDSNFVVLMQKLGLSLDNLATITSNLNAQAQSNTNVLSEVSDMIRHTDQLVQGLKRHWFFKGAFK
jgi:ABC-type transporter Mla subunit MlaD